MSRCPKTQTQALAKQQTSALLRGSFGTNLFTEKMREVRRLAATQWEFLAPERKGHDRLGDSRRNRSQRRIRCGHLATMHHSVAAHPGSREADRKPGMTLRTPDQLCLIQMTYVSPQVDYT